MEGTEKTILEAAEKLFLEQGFEKTTTMQIAKLAGCNHALIHYYFRTKDLLFEKIIEDKMSLIANSIFNINEDENSTIEEKISAIVDMHFDLMMKNEHLAGFIIHELIGNETRLQKTFEKLVIYPQSIIGKMETILEKEHEKGNIRKIEAIDLLANIVSLDVMPFVVAPTLCSLLKIDDDTRREILMHRKDEIKKTLLAYVKAQ